jgi:hypothetical protein
LAIDNWHPARLNQWDGRHWSVRARLKRRDRETVGLYARLAAVPPAAGKRRVSLRLTLAPRQRAGDPDAYWKSTLDALMHAGLLCEDNRQAVELGEVTFERGPARRTSIVLEDVGAELVERGRPGGRAGRQHRGVPARARTGAGPAAGAAAESRAGTADAEAATREAEGPAAEGPVTFSPGRRRLSQPQTPSHTARLPCGDCHA